MNPSLLTGLYTLWIWMGPVIILLALAALIYLIAGVVTTIKQAHLFRVPLSEEQELRFSEGGRVVLSTEGPRLSRRFAGLQFELRGTDGVPIPSRRALFRARTSGITTVRTEHLILDVPRPGAYLLRMNGLGAPRESDANHAVVFMRPHLARSITYVVGIVLASGLLIGSLVTFLLRLSGVPPDA